jgi:hypothetical protein
VCATITWQSGTVSRRARGRTFIGPLYASGVDSTTGFLDVDLVTTLDGGAQGLLDDLTTAGNPLVVYSRVGDTAYPITIPKVGFTPRTLRSRTLD